MKSFGHKKDARKTFPNEACMHQFVKELTWGWGGVWGLRSDTDRCMQRASACFSVKIKRSVPFSGTSAEQEMFTVTSAPGARPMPSLAERVCRKGHIGANVELLMFGKLRCPQIGSRCNFLEVSGIPTAPQRRLQNKNRFQILRSLNRNRFLFMDITRVMRGAAPGFRESSHHSGYPAPRRKS